MPLTFAAVTLVLVDAFSPPGSGWWPWLLLATLVVAAALYVRLGTPRGHVVDVAAPVEGPWRALNSPASRVPSHRVHAWAQTYALDLVLDPPDGSRPGWSWAPRLRRAEEFPGFGEPVRAPVSGEVVRAFSAARDHRARNSPPGMVLLLLESVRELLGPPGVVGNHVVIRDDEGVHALLAHLRRGSLRVSTGDRVDRGAVVAECGNSGNSTEPHLHVQVMDRASAWIAAGLPMRFGGTPLPDNGELLAAA